MAKPTIAITGANGFVGKALVEHFSRQGWHVKALVHRSLTDKSLKNVSYITYDLASEPPDEAFKDTDYLVHAAYIKDDRKNPKAFEQNIQGTKRLLKKCRQYKLKKTLFMSSMSAHEQALSSYGKHKFELEKLFNTPEDIVLRSGLILGDGGLGKQMIDFMKTKHLAPLIDGGDQPLQVVAIYDLASVIEILLKENWHGIFTIGTPEVYSYREFYDTVRRELDIKAWLIPVPLSLLLLVVRVTSFLHLPLNITMDNVLGLKKLQAFETLPDLKKINVKLDQLEKILQGLYR